MLNRLLRDYPLRSSEPRSSGLGRRAFWYRAIAFALVSLCALAGCAAQKDECSRPDEYWCNGSVVESCHEDRGHKYIVSVYDCSLLAAQCEEHDGEADCVFAELSCSDRPPMSCEDSWHVVCREGWSSPVPVHDCEHTILLRRNLLGHSGLFQRTRVMLFGYAPGEVLRRTAFRVSRGLLGAGGHLGGHDLHGALGPVVTADAAARPRRPLRLKQASKACPQVAPPRLCGLSSVKGERLPKSPLGRSCGR